LRISDFTRNGPQMPVTHVTGWKKFVRWRAQPATCSTPCTSLPSARSVRDTWADTTTPHGRLMLTVLGGLAEFERELILARTSDGRKRAKARGVKFGRPPKLTRRTSGRKLSSGSLMARRKLTSPEVTLSILPPLGGCKHETNMPSWLPWLKDLAGLSQPLEPKSSRMSSVNKRDYCHRSRLRLAPTAPLGATFPVNSLIQVLAQPDRFKLY